MGPPFSEGVGRKEGVTIFRRVAIFQQKINYNLECFRTKKNYKQE